MSTQCDICPNVIYDEEQGTFYEQNRVVTSPGYWEYQFTTKSSSFEENMLHQYLEMLSKDSSGFTVCNNCKTMLENDINFAQELRIEDQVKSIPGGQVDLNAAGIVLGSVWKKMRGSWPTSIEVKGFDTNVKLGNKEEKKVEKALKPTNSISSEKKSDIKKSEESERVHILQKQIKELDKRNSELEKKIDSLEKRIKSSSPQEQKKVMNPISVLTPIISVILIISILYLNNKIDSLHNNQNIKMIENNHPNSDNDLDHNSIPPEINNVTKTDNGRKKILTPVENKIKNTKPNEIVKSDLISVPNVKGLYVLDATTKLSSVELKVTVIKVSFGEENINKVIKQNPSVGKQVKKGSSVIIQVGE